MNVREQLAAELREVIRRAAEAPEELEGRIPLLVDLAGPQLAQSATDSEQVRFVLQELIPRYIARLPKSRDGLATRELFAWEDEDGNALSLTTRHAKAAEHLVTTTENVRRRGERRLLVACARRFIAFAEEDRRAEQAAPADAPPSAIGADALAQDESLSPLAQDLWVRQFEDHEVRLSGIRSGIIRVRSQEEMLDLLFTLTEAATTTLHAVDQTDLARWFGDGRLQRYLDAQLECAQKGEVSVERIRVVRRADLWDAGRRSLLREFIRLHEEAGAALYLCPDDALRRLDTDFLDPPVAMVLIDVEAIPACLVSPIDERGYVQRSTMYLRTFDPVRSLYADWLRVKQTVVRRDFRKSVSDHLDRFRDDPPMPSPDDLLGAMHAPIAPPGGPSAD